MLCISFINYWLCLSNCLNTLNSKVIFGKAPFGFLTADVWGYMCLGCASGPSKLIECLLSGYLNRCPNTYAFSLLDQQKDCIFWNPLLCLYCDVRIGSCFSFSFNTAEKQFTSKVTYLKITFNSNTMQCNVVLVIGLILALIFVFPFKCASLQSLNIPREIYLIPFDSLPYLGSFQFIIVLN